MKTLHVRGGVPLSGTVSVGGSKNAVLPLLFATLLTDGVSEFSNVPDIADVGAASEILRAFGAKTSFSAGVFRVDTTDLSYCQPPNGAVRRIRASSYLIGAALARFGQTELLPFGGCAFCDRPVDMHLSAAEAFGAERRGDTFFAKDGLCGARISFPKVSVGATVNAVLMATLAAGDSVIENAATEPHVTALCEYLCAAGADIRAEGTTLYVRGVTGLHGATARVIPDMIEGGTYLLAGLMTGGEVTVSDLSPDHLSSFFAPLIRAGAIVNVAEREVLIYPTDLSAFSVAASPYPGFPTDLAPQTAALLSRFSGGTVRDLVFPERFGYLETLLPFGVDYTRFPGGVNVRPSRIRPAETTVCDLRGGAAALLLALCAGGRSVLGNAGLLPRGYEKIAEKLTALGADIKVEN